VRSRTGVDALSAEGSVSEIAPKWRHQLHGKSPKKRQSVLIIFSSLPCCSNLELHRKFKTCSEAISAGLEAFQREEFAEAIDAFTRSLELPGDFLS